MDEGSTVYTGFLTGQSCEDNSKSAAPLPVSAERPVLFRFGLNGAGITEATGNAGR
ncbi:MAG: hypothetical protein ACXWTP_06185 [Methylosarcina sp.]